MSRTDHAQRIGRRIWRARRAAGLTQADLAAVTGLTQGHVSCLERGANLPWPRTLRRLAMALGVDPAQLDPEGDEMSKTLDALRNGQTPVPGMPVKRGFPGVPCIRCGETDCVSVLLHNVLRFHCEQCEATFDAADVELVFIAYAPVLDWLHAAPIIPTVDQPIPSKE